jgi:putative addiction module CopG family antidote
MVVELPQDLEKFISEQVTRGRFATANEAIPEAVRLLRLQPTLSVGVICRRSAHARGRG